MKSTLLKYIFVPALFLLVFQGEGRGEVFSGFGKEVGEETAACVKEHSNEALFLLIKNADNDAIRIRYSKAWNHLDLAESGSKLDPTVLTKLGDDLLDANFATFLEGGVGRVKAWEFAVNAPAARINTGILQSISTALNRTLKDMPDVVSHANHPNITNYTVTHIFRGHGTGGHHHVASLISDNTKKLKGRANIGSDGFYKADIEVNGTLRNDVGFFPDEWDELKVIDEVKHAWEEAINNPAMPVNGLYYGKTTTGQWIRMTKNNTYNNIQNAFPDFNYTP